MRWMNGKMVHNYQRGFGPQRMVLLLTSLGSKSGLPRITPLQYEEIEGAYYIVSARGRNADWYCNIRCNLSVQFQVGDEVYSGWAEIVNDPVRIADFLKFRLKKKPLFIGLLFLLEGLPLRWKNADMECLAAKKAMVILHPDVITEKLT